jgi:hypothetical protein
MLFVNIPSVELNGEDGCFLGKFVLTVVIKRSLSFVKRKGLLPYS